LDEKPHVYGFSASPDRQLELEIGVAGEQVMLVRPTFKGSNLGEEVASLMESGGQWQAWVT
jgi:hypothetical protein